MLDAAFLQDIVEHAGDDAPRLIYADWLEEHGDPDRAELIRLQCRRAQLADNDALAGPLAAQEAKLLSQHGQRWRAALPALPGITWGDFSRGFVEAARAESPEALRGPADALFRAAPVRRLRIA